MALFAATVALPSQVMFGSSVTGMSKVETTSQRPSQIICSASSKASDKGFLEWLSETLDKADMNETMALMNKVEGKNGAATAKPSAGGRKGAAAPAPQKKGGFTLPSFGKK